MPWSRPRCAMALNESWCGFAGAPPQQPTAFPPTEATSSAPETASFRWSATKRDTKCPRAVCDRPGAWHRREDTDAIRRLPAGLRLSVAILLPVLRRLRHGAQEPMCLHLPPGDGPSPPAVRAARGHAVGWTRPICPRFLLESRPRTWRCAQTLSPRSPAFADRLPCERLGCSKRRSGTDFTPRRPAPTSASRP